MKMGLLILCLLSSTTFANQVELKARTVMLKKIKISQGAVLLSSESDDGQTIADFESAQKACKDFVGGELPDAPALKEIIKELSTRLQPDYYWSTTIGTECAAKECRIQIESPTLVERNENVLNATGAAICITEQEENPKQ